MRQREHRDEASDVVPATFLNEAIRASILFVAAHEDDETESHRRIAAACIHYGLDYPAALAQVHFIRQPGGKVSFATTGENGRVMFPQREEIIGRLQDVGAVLLTLDPFNHAHDLPDGNNNVMMARVAGEVTAIAKAARCAALVLHHLRKGANGSTDDLMGATSLRATFRSCRILARMDPETARKMSIADGWRYVRVVGSKENYAPPPERATWYRLVGVELGNGNDEYPEGDNVAVATTWQPWALFEGMDTDTLRRVFDALQKTVYGPSRQAKHTPWAGKVLMEIGHRSEREATKIVKEWIEHGVLVKGPYYHNESRHEVGRVTRDQAKADAILADLGGVNALSE